MSSLTVVLAPMLGVIALSVLLALALARVAAHADHSSDRQLEELRDRLPRAAYVPQQSYAGYAAAQPMISADPSVTR
jgi:hypothetical protein